MAKGEESFPGTFIGVAGICLRNCAFLLCVQKKESIVRLALALLISKWTKSVTLFCRSWKAYPSLK